MKRLVVIAGLLLAAPADAADEPIANDVVLSVSGDNPSQLVKVWFGSSFRALMWANVILEQSGKPRLFCLRDDVALSPKQAADIMGGFIKSYPEAKDKPAGNVLALSLVSAFPCKKGEK
jgi:hypothetical protein